MQIEMLLPLLPLPVIAVILSYHLGRLSAFRQINSVVTAERHAGGRK